MDHGPPPPPTAPTIARLVLPQVDDLWGTGWSAVPDEGGAAEAEAATSPDACLPEDYPDESAVADAAVTFERPGALVHAVATVFDAVPAATRAWTIVGGEAFARCFAESVAAEVDLPADAHLLGPLSPPGQLAIDRDGVRTATHRATWARAGADGVLPVVLDLAAVLCRRALVVVWSVDEDRTAATPGWSRLVERLERRGDAARALD